MKRGEFIRELLRAGCVLKRHGRAHDIYINPSNGRTVPVPRHTEIKNTLAELVRKQLGIARSRNE